MFNGLYYNGLNKSYEYYYDHIKLNSIIIDHDNKPIDIRFKEDKLNINNYVDFIYFVNKWKYVSIYIEIISYNINIYNIDKFILLLRDKEYQKQEINFIKELELEHILIPYIFIEIFRVSKYYEIPTNVALIHLCNIQKFIVVNGWLLETPKNIII